LVRKDIPPYVKVAREPMSYAGINSVGLRRRGFTNEKIFEIQKIYRAIFQMKMNVSQALLYIEKEMLPTAERDEILQFIQNSPRGIVKGYGTGRKENNKDKFSTVINEKSDFVLMLFTYLFCRTTDRRIKNGENSQDFYSGKKTAFKI
jgi:hypothetical protein